MIDYECNLMGSELFEKVGYSQRRVFNPTTFVECLISLAILRKVRAWALSSGIPDRHHRIPR